MPVFMSNRTPALYPLSHRLLVAWQEAVFALYLAEGKIEPEVARNMRTWEHSGFSVDQSVFLPAAIRRVSNV